LIRAPYSKRIFGFEVVVQISRGCRASQVLFCDAPDYAYASDLFLRERPMRPSPSNPTPKRPSVAGSGVVRVPENVVWIVELLASRPLTVVSEGRVNWNVRSPFPLPLFRKSLIIELPPTVPEIPVSPTFNV
jgi:hypothetical protein